MLYSFVVDSFQYTLFVYLTNIVIGFLLIASCYSLHQYGTIFISFIIMDI